MKHGQQRKATMAELAEAARSDQPQRAAGVDQRRTLQQQTVDNPYVIEIDRLSYDVVEEPELSPAQAQALAALSRLVIWDACGCGGGCGYATWSGSQVNDLINGGPPVVEDGALFEVRDQHGISSGVLVVQDVHWGRLH